MPDRSSLVLSRRNRRLDQRRARASRLRMGGVGLGIVISIVIAVLILLGALAYADLTRDLPNVALLPALLNPPDGLLLQPTHVYDRTGQHLLFVFDSAYTGAGDPAPHVRRYIPLSPASPQHLPDFLARATVVLAEPGFWSGGGYSLAGLTTPDSHPTIAQKLVSELLLYGEQPSLRRALRERILAAQLTSEYGPSQVLEWYLNSADYGNYAYGIDAAAEFYYGVAATDLTPAESAVLAAASQSPDLNPLDAPDLALQRGRTAIQLMQKFGLASSSDASAALAQSPQLSKGAHLQDLAHAYDIWSALILGQLDSQFTRQRITRGGLSITTTMDYDLQQSASCVTSGDSSLGSSSCSAGQARVLQSSPAASIILDPQTGQILAADDTGSGASLTLPHDPGTLLSPFVYLTAFTRGFGPGSLVWDIPSASSSTGDAAGNAGTGTFHGPVRMRIALVNDYLAALQHIAAQMGSDAIGRTEASFGLDSPPLLAQPAAAANPSASSNATLLDLASAYGIFAANGVQYGAPRAAAVRAAMWNAAQAGSGVRNAPTAVLRLDGLDHSVWLDLSNPQAQPVVTPGLAYIMNNVLSDESARWPSLGHPNNLEIGRPLGVKLGQSADGSDAWAIGYTPTRVVAVWTGTQIASSASAQPPTSPQAPAAAPKSAISDPQSLLSALLPLATASLPADGWAAPPDVTTLQVCDPSGLLPTRDCPNVVTEVFLSGNEPAQPDTLFRTFTINRETGLLATVFTPPELIEDQVFMVVPPEAQDWARSAKIPSAPTSYDAIQAVPINPDVHISTPAMFSEVSGAVVFRGSASGVGFDHYRLLVGQGLNPQSWTQVGSDSSTRIEDGLLGTWDTTGLSGLYAVELQVIRTDQTIDTAITQLTVKGK